MRAVFALSFLLLAAACGGETDESARAPAAGGVESAEVERRAQADGRAEAEQRAPACAARAERSLRTPALAYAAIVERPTAAFRRPGRGRFASFGLRNANDVPTVFGVLSAVAGRDCKPAWYRVQLPRKPNGVTGYVRADAVKLIRVRTRIEVDLSARRVTLFRSGRAVVSTEAAIGSSATPTPTGSFYVDQRLIPYDTSGPFGPGAIGIAAYSEVLTGWAQGGPIAIHGTNQPWSIGKAVSNGCIRVRNPVLKRLFAAALPGTPVTIRP